MSMNTRLGTLEPCGLHRAYVARAIGKALLNHVVDYLKLQGCHRIELTVTDINEAAINLYRGLGFDMTGNSEPLRDGSKLKNLEMALDAR